MKKYYILLLSLLFSVVISNAQQRVQMANFSQFQQFFNPALTGNQGTMIKGFYRDHWDSFEGAPRSFFFAGELNLADVLGKGVSKGALTHALGVSLLNDSYGSQVINKYALSYKAGYQITKTLRLNAGASASYGNTRFDLQDNDIILGEDESTGFSDDVNSLSISAGAALTSDNFYVGYALNDFAENKLSDNTYFNDMYAMQHIVQAGYRRAVSPQFGLVITGIFSYDELQQESIEGQLKAVYKNAVWIGGGYRNDLAYTVTGGFKVSNFKIGYSREIYTSEVNNLFKGGNEISLSYNFSSKNSSKKLSIW